MPVPFGPLVHPPVLWASLGVVDERRLALVLRHGREHGGFVAAEVLEPCLAEFDLKDGVCARRHVIHVCRRDAFVAVAQLQLSFNLFVTVGGQSCESRHVGPALWVLPDFELLRRPWAPLLLRQQVADLLVVDLEEAGLDEELPAERADRPRRPERLKSMAPWALRVPWNHGPIGP